MILPSPNGISADRTHPRGLRRELRSPLHRPPPRRQHPGIVDRAQSSHWSRGRGSLSLEPRIRGPGGGVGSKIKTPQERWGGGRRTGVESSVFLFPVNYSYTSHKLQTFFEIGKKGNNAESDIEGCCNA